MIKSFRDNGVVSLASLKIPPGNMLEILKDDRKGQYSIRINDQFEFVLCGPMMVWITSKLPITTK